LRTTPVYFQWQLIDDWPPPTWQSPLTSSSGPRPNLEEDG
jgi:hypothetical protein